MRAGSTVLLTAMSCMASGGRPARWAAAAIWARMRSTFSRILTQRKINHPFDSPTAAGSLRAACGHAKELALFLGAWSLQLGAVFQRLAGKVIQGKCQQQKAENRNAIGDRHVLRYGVGQRILGKPIARFD